MTDAEIARIAAEWTGRSHDIEARIDAFPARALAAALDLGRDFATGDPLPPGWHWLYGHEPVAGRDTGPDGHPRLGLLMPPLPLSRRMWAGGRLQSSAPLRIGERLRRRSTVRSIRPKTGRSGRLVFVTVEERFESDEGLLVEERDIVYREPAPLATEPPAAGAASASGRRWSPDEVLLFRYSALTYNGHRIHYDHRYATGVEGYPGLVVHGPLLATLMLLRVEERVPDRPVSAFAFRARAPLFVGRPLWVDVAPVGGAEAPLRVQVRGDDGRLAMEGEAWLA